jgi:ketosteroid isomerase-like protein
MRFERSFEMKGKILAVVGMVILGSVLFLNSRQAQASISPAIAFDNVFVALNAGDMDTALSLFAEDATAENLVRAESFRGASQIRQMLQDMQREGRRYDVVNVTVDGDTVTAIVDVSDKGLVWGSETIEAKMNDVKLQSFTVVAFRLELWRIRR